jgi:hypothetical protein
MERWRRWTFGQVDATLPRFHQQGKEHLLMAKPRRRRKIGSKKRKARRDRRKR